MTIEEVLSLEEKQIFDRKSINIDPKALAIPLVAFANADGGIIAIGISDKTRRIVAKPVFELLLREMSYSEPTIQNLLKIYDEIETNHVFGASEVAKILGLSYTGARKVLVKLTNMNVLAVVKGKGKGKYRFLNHNEIK